MISTTFFQFLSVHVQLIATLHRLIKTTKKNQLNPYRLSDAGSKNAPTLSQADDAWAEKLLSAKATQECYIPQK